MGDQETFLLLRDLVAKLNYPHTTRDTVLGQLYHACVTYHLKPVVVRDPTPQNATRPGVPPPAQQNIICLKGSLVITVQNRGYQTPIDLYVLLAFPFVYPYVYVRAYPGAILRPGHPFVHPETGYIDLTSPQLPPGTWRPNDNSIPAILMRLQSAFSQSPPLREDPKYAERRLQMARLTPMVQERMKQEAADARREFVELQQKLRELRERDVTMSMQIRRQAEEAGGGVGVKLAAVRESLAKIEAQASEYGVDDADADITLEGLLGLTAGHPLRDERDDLEMEDKALADALEATSHAVANDLISLDEFMKQSKILSGKQFHVRARMLKVGTEMDAIIEAEEREATTSQGGSGGASGGAGGTQRSNFLMSGMFLKSHVTRGAAPLPTPGPPVRVQAGVR